MLRQVYLPGGGVITAALNFPAKITAGIAQAIVTRLTGSRVTVGVLAGVANIKAKVRNELSVSQITYATGTSNADQSAGIEQDIKMELAGMPQNAGVTVNKTKIGLVHQSGANVATNIGANAWTNPANAQGLRNNVSATGVSNALGARTYQLRLEYPNHVNKTELTITKVQLRFSTSQAGTLLDNGNVQLGYRFATSGAFTMLSTRTGNFNDITGPALAFDITAAVGGDWSKLNALETTVLCALPLAVTNINVACDAVTVYIEATREDSF